MREEDVEKKLSDNWDKFIPIINSLESSCELEPQCNALITIDKKLRPSGPRSKAQGAFIRYLNTD